MTPMSNKMKIGIFVTIVLVAIAALRVFNIYNKNTAKDSNSVAEKVAVALSKYPADAQGFALTKACQTMQKDTIVKSGVASDQTDLVSLPVCTCITALAMKRPEFPLIEKSAVEKKDFFVVLTEFKEILNPIMKECVQ